jgi:hypothetical protein
MNGQEFIVAMRHPFEQSLPLSTQLPVARALDRSTTVDIFTGVDTRSCVMLKLFTRTLVLAVEFCERCGLVCDAACRRNAIVERARDRALQGMRVS